MLRILGFEVKTMLDENADLSYLKTEYDNDLQLIVNSARYSNQTVTEYKWPMVRRWIDEDHSRLAAYNQGEWVMLGISVVANLVIDTKLGDTYPFSIYSGGLWGIESDSDNDYLISVAKDQANDLIDVLRTLRFKLKDIKQAIEEMPLIGIGDYEL